MGDKLEMFSCWKFAREFGPRECHVFMHSLQDWTGVAMLRRNI
jgi:hypothetical protein